jgi:hypothetical protein
MFNMEEEPRCGEIVFDDPWERERGYEIVGVEEVARPGRWNLVLERLDWSEFLNRVHAKGRIAFGMVRLP